MKARIAVLRFLALLTLFNLLIPGVGAQEIFTESGTIDYLPTPPPILPIRLNQITGYVRDYFGNPIVGVGVNALPIGTDVSMGAQTDTDGYYAFYVTNAVWDIFVNCNVLGGTNANGLKNLGYQCVNDETVVISNANGTANFITPFGINTTELSGTVSNIDGTLITNIIVTATGSNGVAVTVSAQTDVNGFYELIIPTGDTYTVTVDSNQVVALGYAPVAGYTSITNGSYPNQFNVDNINFTLVYAPPCIPFFTNQAALGNYAYYLQPSTNNFFGYYSLQNFPFVYHFDLGWEYFVDAQNAANGAYIYDYTSGDWWYTEPGIFPYIYDFTFQAWLYCYPNTSAPGTYYSNPRIFYNFGTSNTWFD